VHGILVKGGKNMLYIPKSRYNMLDDDALISLPLKELPKSIIDNTFKEVTYATLSMQKAHALVSPVTKQA
jgi:hypothetical protein